MFKRVHEEIPEFVEEIQKRGLSMTQIYPAPYHNDGKASCTFMILLAVQLTGNQSNYFDYTGVDTFGHTLQPGDDAETVKRKVEEQVRRLTDDFEWLEDGSIKVVQHVTGKKHPRFPALSSRF
jgi:hypothetical protein